MHIKRLNLLERLSVAMTILILAGQAAAQSSGRFDTIAITGQLTPTSIVGSGPFASFDVPYLNSAGQVTFRGTFTSGGTVTGIYLGSLAEVSNVAIQGTSAPGGGLYSSLGLPSINNAGQVVFSSSTSGGSGSGLYEGTASSVSALGLQGQANPGGGTFSGFTFSNQNIWAVNDSGKVIFIGGGELDLASPSGIVNIAQSGASAPGGGTFTVIQAPAFNNSGNSAFGANISGGTNFGMFIGTSSGITKVAVTGGSAPGGGTFSDFTSAVTPPAINSSGQIAFIASTTGASSPGKGLYLASISSVSSIALAGTSAPGGGVFATFNLPSLNNSGNAAFVASTTGGAGTGIFVSTSTGLKNVALQGGNAPGGGIFGQFSTSTSAGNQISFNNAGLVAFSAFNQTSTNIYLGDGTDLIRAAAAGDTIGGLVANSVSLAAASGSQESGLSPLNDFGQVAFRASFSGGKSGIFIYTPTLHWRATGASTWSNSANWTLGITPASVHDVVIDPSSALTVTGPSTSTSVNSLQVGGGAGAAVLDLQNSATLTVAAGLNIAANGSISGNGSIGGNVTNSGLFSPGEPLGSIHVTGDLLENASGVMKLEIGGLVGGSSYDKIAITGTMTLGGALNVTLANGFTPAAGEVFDLLDWGSVAGSFAQVNLPTLAGGLAWDAGQLSTNGSVTVVPEPRCAGLFGGAGLLLLVRWRSSWRLRRLPASS